MEFYPASSRDATDLRELQDQIDKFSKLGIEPKLQKPKNENILDELKAEIEAEQRGGGTKSPERKIHDIEEYEAERRKEVQL